jgi:hypothetical protein
MEYDPRLRLYTKRLHDLRQNYRYHWKVTINNTWSKNYGIYGQNSHEAMFVTNSFGAVRLIFIPHLSYSKLHYDHCVIDWCLSSDLRLKHVPYPIE